MEIETQFAELPLQAIDALALDAFPSPIPLRPRAKIPTASACIFDLFYYHEYLRGNAYGRWMDVALIMAVLSYRASFSTHFAGCGPATFADS